MTLAFEEFKKTELRVAKVLDVQDIPGADRLWKLLIDVGSEKKEIVAGIKLYYTREALLGKSVVVVNNLAPSVIRGVESQGMLLGAKSDAQFSLLVLDKELPAGSPNRLMRRLEVSLKNRSYPIFVGQHLLEEAGPLLKRAGLAKRHLLIVSQKQVAVYYEKPLRESLAREGFESSLFLTPRSKSSEASKTQPVWARLIKTLAALDGKNRSLALVALGGGVIGDLTGFAAAVYRRGIPYVQIPTTLTAQVDSAIGGKTGVDLPEGKNLLGVIYQPAAVLCDTSVLSSLPERHWSDGFAEVIKYGVIKDPSLFAWLERAGLEAIRHEPRSLEKVVACCAKIKAAVVVADEFDKMGVRIILNFGHTAGHAIEAASGYSGRYTHGEAVAVGMLIACDISKHLGILKDGSLTERLERTLLKFGLPVYTKGLSGETILKTMGYDKKSEGQKNRFVLPVRMGRVTIESDVPTSVIEEALAKEEALSNVSS